MRRFTLGLGVTLTIVALAGVMLGTAQSATPTYGKCKPTGKYNSITLPHTLHANTLTVGFVQLTPLTYKGNTPAKVNDGYNYCLAANIAWRAGLAKIKLVKVDFAQLVVGRLNNFDVAIDDIYIKPERQKKVDFSIPYGHSYAGVTALASNPPTQANLKNLKIGTTLGSVDQKWMDEVLKPTQQYATFDDTPTLFAALLAKQIDAVLIDLPVALPYASQSHGQVKVYAQVKVGGQVGIVMQKGTPNRLPINRMVRQLLGNGTIKNLEKKYYFAAFGGVDPDSLPVWG